MTAAEVAHSTSKVPDLCLVISRHPERIPRAADGLRVCAGHRARIEQLIAELPGLYDDLGCALISTNVDTEHRGSGTNPGLSLDLRAIEARDEIHAELVRFARHVAEERGMTVPADTIPALSSWLMRHVEWLCAQPDADETHDYLAALHRHSAIAFPSGRRRFPIGVTCNRPVSCDAITRRVQHCEGRLVALLMPDDDRENLSEVTCDTCGLEVPLKAASLPESWGSVA